MTYSTTKEWFAMSPRQRFRYVMIRKKWMTMMFHLAECTPYSTGGIIEASNSLLKYGK